jgi:hypothetical protein
MTLSVFVETVGRAVERAEPPEWSRCPGPPLSSIAPSASFKFHPSRLY